MIQLSHVEVLSDYGQFRGTKFSKRIEFGVENKSSSILLEGVTVFYQNIAFDGLETFVKTYAMINRVDDITDNVGTLTFWIEDDQIECQMNLLATPAVFDDIYATLCTLKENYMYNFSVTTDSGRLSQKDNAIKSYSMTFKEVEE